MKLLNDVKKHLNIEIEFTDDDNQIYQLIDISKVAISNFLNIDIDELEELPLPIKHGIILLTSHFYLNRNMVAFGGAPVDIPYSFKFLLEPYKNFIIN